MDKIKGQLTVYYDGMYWAGLFERNEGNRLSASKVIFGSEPSEARVYEFILKHGYELQYSPAVEAVVKEAKKNPKRMRREARKQMAEAGIGTKAQQALKLQHEQQKLERGTRSREEKKAEAERKFQLKQQKKRAKHRGR
ncbi:YjdF family protein [bacterium 210820-DFI.6.37]|nr:YjdF family protein [bacterium 210820-DFI.6.37]